MTARSLRLLISVALVFAVFLYLVSVQMNGMVPVKAPDEGLLGGPVKGLTRWQLSKFEEGRSLFSKQFSVKEGLGPLYNASSCSECHGGAGTVGGAGDDLAKSSISMIAKRVDGGKFAKEPAKSVLTKTEAADLVSLINEGGPILVRNSISDLKTDPPVFASPCPVEASKAIPKDAEFHSRRIATQMYGLGLIDSIPDALLTYSEAQQKRNPKAPHGRSVQTARLSFSSPAVGRFGHKCQDNSLFVVAAKEFGVQLGVSNPIFRHSISTQGLDKFPDCVKTACPPDINNDGSTINKINFYLMTLAPPPRGPITVEVRRGNTAFQKAACASCHIPAFPTPEKVFVINPDAAPMKIEELPPAKPGGEARLSLLAEPKTVEVRALENKTVDAYSDFLVHDMGAALADGIAQDGSKSSEWRTAPLWGLRMRKFYMHDGRAKKIEEAIAMHAGQAADSVKEYGKLSEQEKKDLLAFLNSL